MPKKDILQKQSDKVVETAKPDLAVVLTNLKHVQLIDKLDIGSHFWSPKDKLEFVSLDGEHFVRIREYRYIPMGAVKVMIVDENWSIAKD